MAIRLTANREAKQAWNDSAHWFSACRPFYRSAIDSYGRATKDFRFSRQRRRWDSNPRTLSGLRFSRPAHSTALPPLLNRCSCIAYPVTQMRTFICLLFFHPQFSGKALTILPSGRTKARHRTESHYHTHPFFVIYTRAACQLPGAALQTRCRAYQVPVSFIEFATVFRCVIVTGLSLCPAFKPRAGALTPAQLRVEWLPNPLTVDAEKPRLPWLVESPSRGEIQSACRVLVATSTAALAEDCGDLWDSSKVADHETLGIAYAGQPLASGQPVFWKLKVWNKAG